MRTAQIHHETNGGDGSGCKRNNVVVDLHRQHNARNTPAVDYYDRSDVVEQLLPLRISHFDISSVAGFPGY
jgi:hypothetical protein